MFYSTERTEERFLVDEARYSFLLVLVSKSIFTLLKETFSEF